MIYTITCNPSLDYVVSVETFRIGVTNRTVEESIVPGGKGINVSIVLKNLDVPSTAIGFLAGFTGGEIAKRTEDLGILAKWIWLEEGYSRINVKIKGQDEVSSQFLEGTEINARGPKISEDQIQELKTFLQQLQESDVLVLAGSIPSTMPSSLYEELMQLAMEKKALTVVDTSGDSLKKILPFHPFLIKPNKQELEEFFCCSLKSKNEIIVCAKKLQQLGAKNVLVSLAGDGAILVAEDGGLYQSVAPKGTFVNGVGAGDSMVAGFLAGWLENKEYAHAFYMGIAAGSATAFSEYLANKEEIKSVYAHMMRISD